ncbi:hypothetical protein BBSC_1541 [Bifidobacterium scardovii JCM 12489 = DSM 13734]|nr:hypothetical protein BBSC_1541 [Bifidobacterium scardovii JCM 12489 = DSM 13734]
MSPARCRSCTDFPPARPVSMTPLCHAENAVGPPPCGETPVVVQPDRPLWSKAPYLSTPGVSLHMHCGQENVMNRSDERNARTGGPCRRRPV